MTSPIRDPFLHPDRAEAPRRHGHLGATVDEAFDRFTRLASASLRAPMALISLVEADSQVIKSCLGMTEPGASRREMPLACSFCQHVVTTGEALLIPDVRHHPLASSNQAIQEFGVVAYAGIPLVTTTGHRIGVICVLDTASRDWTSEDVALLTDLAATLTREIELRDVVHHQGSLLDSTGEGIFGVDLKGCGTFINRSASAMLGYGQDEVIGRNMHELIHHHYPDGRAYPQDQCRIFHAFRNAEGVRMSDEVLWRRNGEAFPVEYSSYPITENGRITGAIINFSDITDRKQAEEERERLLAELVAERARLEAVLQQMPAGVLIAEVPDGRIILGNHQVEEILRHPICFSKTIADYHEWNGFHLDGRPVQPEEWPLARAILRGEIVSGEEIECVRGDGSHCVISLNAAPIRNQDEETVAGVVTIADVTERKEAEARLRFLADAGTVLSGSFDYEAALQRLLQLAVPDHADWCSIDILEADEELQRTAVAHVDPMKLDFLRENHQRYPMFWDRWCPVQQVIQSTQALMLPEVNDELLQQIVFHDDHLEFLRLLNPRSVIIAPLVTQSRLLGIMVCAYADSGRQYQSSDLDLFMDLASRAAVALDNARLYQQLAEREQRLQDLVERLLAAQEEERRRVAYEVHDGLAQVAASAHQHLQAFAGYHRPRSLEARNQLERVLELAQRTVQEARVVVANLRPTTLDDFGLAAAVQLEVESLQKEGWEIRYNQELGDKRLPSQIETALFRMAQEALTNVRKHANSTEVQIELRLSERVVRLEIQDWGQGFDPSAVPQRNGSDERVGLVGMRERITLLGGHFTIKSEVGVGTHVMAT
ncbi:MAG TPA: GAF domain-containing protein, partial [Nitrolancea sp.]|nr:GAF domain-containing protein [Nitrolancea sp.]